MLDFGFYNIDCMKGMKEFPDNYFDLAIVDPPYGAGFTEGGGCQGWFSKYHQNPENTDNIGSGGYNRFGQRFDRYKPDALHIRVAEMQQELRESEELGRANTQKNHSVGCCPR